MKNEYRTIKITAGMTQEFEIIWTNAPDHVIKAQLMYIAACEEEGKQVPENPYGMIEEFGYVANVIGSQDSLTTEDLEDAIIDAEFDYYEFQEGELRDMLDGNVFAVLTKEDDIRGLHAIAEKIPMSCNLVYYTKDCKIFIVCKTWKDAQELARQWNKDFKITESRR